MSVKSSLLFLLVSAIATGLPCPTAAAKVGRQLPEYIKWHVRVVNGLSNNTELFVHCKSKDDDLGIQSLSPGTNFSWSFMENFFQITLFWCYLRKDDAHAAFKVFWPDVLLFYKCQWKSCTWTAKDDGIYLKDLRKGSDELRQNWASGPGQR